MSNGASAVQPGAFSTPKSTSKAATFGSSASAFSQHPEWISKCREILISTETTNIASRAMHWRRIVNEKTDLTNERLNIFIPQHTIPKFEWTITNLSKYIHFVIQWNGLKMKQIKNSPANYEEYERKARNWLNGRRAPNYAGTLFPDMIKSSEQYADTISKQLFGPNNQYSKAYQKILMFGYLHALCSVRISMNDVSKKTFLLCENSIKTNSVTSVLLQQYATDHPFAQYFPSHLKQAADYFHSKFEMDIKRFGNALRLAAGNNMSVNQINPTINNIAMQSVQNTLNLNTNNVMNGMNNINGITGLSINDLNNINSFGLSHYIHNLNGLTEAPLRNRRMGMVATALTLNNRTNQANSCTTDNKSELNLDKININSRDTLSSPLSLTHSNATTSTTSMITNNTNPFHSSSSDSSSSLNPTQQMPNLSMPPQVTTHRKSCASNDFDNARISVNGKQQSVVSFLNQIVNTCNNQQIFMQNLQHRVQCMEQIIRQLQPQIVNNKYNNSGHLHPLPRVEAIETVSAKSTQSLQGLIPNKPPSSQHLQFIIQPSQFQFQGITQQLQPMHRVQQIRSSSIPKQQFIVSQGRPLPNMAATPSNAVSKPIQSIIRTERETNIKLSNTLDRRNVMDDVSAAALLASLKHTIEPKLEPFTMNAMNKRSRYVGNSNNNNNNNRNHQEPPIKKRKIKKDIY